MHANSPEGSEAEWRLCPSLLCPRAHCRRQRGQVRCPPGRAQQLSPWLSQGQEYWGLGAPVLAWMCPPVGRGAFPFVDFFRTIRKAALCTFSGIKNALQNARPLKTRGGSVVGGRPRIPKRESRFHRINLLTRCTSLPRGGGPSPCQWLGAGRRPHSTGGECLYVLE